MKQQHISVDRVLETTIIDSKPSELVVRLYHYGTEFTDDIREYEVEYVRTVIAYTEGHNDYEETVFKKDLGEVIILGLDGDELRNKILEPVFAREIEVGQFSEVKTTFNSVAYCRRLANEKVQKYLKEILPYGV